jgi:hypothetical protein
MSHTRMTPNTVVRVIGDAGRALTATQIGELAPGGPSEQSVLDALEAAAAWEHLLTVTAPCGVVFDPRYELTAKGRERYGKLQSGDPATLEAEAYGQLGFI